MCRGGVGEGVGTSGHKVGRDVGMGGGGGGGTLDSNGYTVSRPSEAYNPYAHKCTSSYFKFSTINSTSLLNPKISFHIYT